MEVNAIVEITHTSDIPRISDALSHGAYIATAAAAAAAAQPHGAVGLGAAAACWDAVKKSRIKNRLGSVTKVSCRIMLVTPV